MSVTDDRAVQKLKLTCQQRCRALLSTSGCTCSGMQLSIRARMRLQHAAKPRILGLMTFDEAWRAFYGFHCSALARSSFVKH